MISSYSEYVESLVLVSGIVIRSVPVTCTHDKKKHGCRPPKYPMSLTNTRVFLLSLNLVWSKLSNDERQLGLGHLNSCYSTSSFPGWVPRIVIRCKIDEKLSFEYF